MSECTRSRSLPRDLARLNRQIPSDLTRRESYCMRARAVENVMECSFDEEASGRVASQTAVSHFWRGNSRQLEWTLRRGIFNSMSDDCLENAVLAKMILSYYDTEDLWLVLFCSKRVVVMGS